MNAAPLDSPWIQVAEIVRLIRTGTAQTRPELADATGLGRNVIALRVQAAQEIGLVAPSGEARSRGGRAAEVWELGAEAGHLLVGLQGAGAIRIALANLRLEVLESRTVEWSLQAEASPQDTCATMATAMEEMLSHQPSAEPWGIGIGLLAPVDAATGRSADPVGASAAAPRWPREFDVAGWFRTRLGLPCWLESVSNLLALGAAAEAGAPEDLVAIRMDLGVGSGIVSAGRLHRGADWLAGEIAHIAVRADRERVCLCGRIGCLDAFAGSWAVEADARRAQADGRSPYLGAMPAGRVGLETVVAGAEAGDPACVDIVLRAAEALGQVLAGIVTWFNPRRVVIGGNALSSSALLHAVLVRSLNASALSASMEHLELRQGSPDRADEVSGALALVRDQLLSGAAMAAWGPSGSPARLTAYDD